MNVAVYTCVTDSYDQLKPHPYIPGVDWIAFTDGGLAVEGWDTRACRFSPKEPRLRAKWHKVFPSKVVPDYETTIWIDGSVEITSPDFVELACSRLADSPIAMFSHPERSCIYDEAVASLDFKKYDLTPVLKQAAYYWDLSHPRHWGLWAGGIIARRKVPPMERLMGGWWTEIKRWGIQDQISLPYVLRQHGIWPGLIPGDLWANRWLKVDLAGHKSDL